MRMTEPSRPSRPTTAEAATTLWTQIMLPGGAADGLQGDDPGRIHADPLAHAELEEREHHVADGVAAGHEAAPMPPMNGAKIGQTPPTSAATPSASTMGICS